MNGYTTSPVDFSSLLYDISILLITIWKTYLKYLHHKAKISWEQLKKQIAKKKYSYFNNIPETLSTQIWRQNIDFKATTKILTESIQYEQEIIKLISWSMKPGHLQWWIKILYFLR